MNIDELNGLGATQARSVFMQCCTASRWAEMMVHALPFENLDAVVTHARKYWQLMNRNDYHEAFDGHPKIGDPASLKEKYRNTHYLAAAEQSSVAAADEQVLEELADLNTSYEERFGYIFIVCASGKSAQEMLELIRQRIHNDPADELAIAASEQDKITVIRIRKLLETDQTDGNCQ